MLTPGTLLANRYRLDRMLGEGGMGEVWSAADDRLRRRVAIKLLKNPEGMGSDKAAAERRRLLREARAASAVQHPGVVRILDVVDGDEAAFLVMELLDGTSLRKHLERGPLDLGATCTLMARVASAVRAAHRKGIVHRDLKPENIFLLRPDSGESVTTPAVKVLDFGIAKVLPESGAMATENLTRTGHLLGSPPYMSPEQTFGEEDIDHRTDLWSFGIVLYECLTGVLPTRASNTGQVFKIITKQGIRPIEEILPGIPPEIARLLGRLLAQDRERRPADLGEVIDLLERYASAQGAPAANAPSSLDSSTGHVVSIEGPRSAPEAPPSRERETRRATGAGGRARRATRGRILALSVLVVSIGIFGLGPLEDKRPDAPQAGGSDGPAPVAAPTRASTSALAPAEPPATPVSATAKPRSEGTDGGSRIHAVGTPAATPVTAAPRPTVASSAPQNVDPAVGGGPPAEPDLRGSGANVGSAVASAPGSATSSAGGDDFDTFPGDPSPPAAAP